MICIPNEQRNKNGLERSITEAVDERLKMKGCGKNVLMKHSISIVGICTHLVVKKSGPLLKFFGTGISCSVCYKEHPAYSIIYQTWEDLYLPRTDLTLNVNLGWG